MARSRRLASKKATAEYIGGSESMLYRLSTDRTSGFPKPVKLIGDPADPRVFARNKAVYDLDEVDAWIERRKALCEEARQP
jgi:predicted DNA-binding transcriptional regulator AlpA